MEFKLEIAIITAIIAILLIPVSTGIGISYLTLAATAAEIEICGITVLLFHRYQHI